MWGSNFKPANYNNKPSQMNININQLQQPSKTVKHFQMFSQMSSNRAQCQAK